LSDSAFLISGLYFRADERALPSPGSLFFSDLEFRLSTTMRMPDGLSTLFSENIGPDETTVFGRGSITLNWSQGAFVTHFPFERPFLYSPAAGNLLLDMRNYGAGGFPPLDAFAVEGDSVSTVGTGSGADRPMGSITTFGLATLFWVDIVPIPEPGTTTLLLLGLFAAGWKLLKAGRTSSSAPSSSFHNTSGAHGVTLPTHC
jgi:hypothetical protein